MYWSLEVATIHEHELNQLDSIRPYGFTLVAAIVASAISCSTWVVANSGRSVVGASQPIFLHAINVGILVMGLSCRG